MCRYKQLHNIWEWKPGRAAVYPLGYVCILKEHLDKTAIHTETSGFKPITILLTEHRLTNFQSQYHPLSINNKELSFLYYIYEEENNSNTQETKTWMHVCMLCYIPSWFKFKRRGRGLIACIIIWKTCTYCLHSNT